MRLFAYVLASDLPHYGDPDNYLALAHALGTGQGLALPAVGAPGWVRRFVPATYSRFLRVESS